MSETKNPGNMSQFYGKKVSELFSRYRPVMSPRLVEAMGEFAAEKLPATLGSVLDVGCGTGLSTRRLARHICLADDARILGLDNSDTQIAEAQKEKGDGRISYRVWDADSGLALPVPRSSVDLVVCAQSAHWLNLPDIFASVDVVLRPGGVLAVAGYPLPKPAIPGQPQLNKDLHAATLRLHDFLMAAGDWKLDRRLLQTAFAGVAWPYTDQRLLRDEAELWLETESSLDDFFHYVQSWSGLRAYHQRCPDGDADRRFEDEFRRLLPDELAKKDARIPFVFPWFLLMCRKPL